MGQSPMAIGLFVNEIHGIYPTAKSGRVERDVTQSSGVLVGGADHTKSDGGPTGAVRFEDV
jgi:hypothetical protein